MQIYAIYLASEFYVACTMRFWLFKLKEVVASQEVWAGH